MITCTFASNAKKRRIAFEDHAAQGVDAVGQIDIVTLGLEPPHRLMEAFEDGKESRRSDAAAVGRIVEQRHRDAALVSGAAAEARHGRQSIGQQGDALVIMLHAGAALRH